MFCSNTSRVNSIGSIKKYATSSYSFALLSKFQRVFLVAMFLKTFLRPRQISVWTNTATAPWTNRRRYLISHSSLSMISRYCLLWNVTFVPVLWLPPVVVSEPHAAYSVSRTVRIGLFEKCHKNQNALQYSTVKRSSRVRVVSGA